MTLWYQFLGEPGLTNGSRVSPIWSFCVCNGRRSIDNGCILNNFICNSVMLYLISFIRPVYDNSTSAFVKKLTCNLIVLSF